MESKKIIEFLEGRRKDHSDFLNVMVESNNRELLRGRISEINTFINFIKAEELKEKQDSEVNRIEPEKGDSKTWLDKETKKALEKIKDDFKAFELRSWGVLEEALKKSKGTNLE